MECSVTPQSSSNTESEVEMRAENRQLNIRHVGSFSGGREKLRQALPQLNHRVASHRERMRRLEQEVTSRLLSEISLTFELLRQYDSDVDEGKGVTEEGDHLTAESREKQSLATTVIERRRTISACQSACDSLRRHFEERRSFLEGAISLLEGQILFAQQQLERDQLDAASREDPNSAKEAFDALVDSLKGRLSARELDEIKEEEDALKAADQQLEGAFAAIEMRCWEMEKDVSWNVGAFAETLKEACSSLSIARLEGKSAQNQYKHWTSEVARTQREAEAAELELKKKEGEVERLMSRLQQSAEELKMAQHHLQLGDLEKMNPEERSHFILQKIRSYDRAIKCIATLSPLFMVERTSKYVVLQYKCPDSRDLEIIIDKLDCTEKVVTVKPRKPGLENTMMRKLHFVTEESDIARIVSRELSHHFVDYSCPAPFAVTMSPAIATNPESCCTSAVSG